MTDLNLAAFLPYQLSIASNAVSGRIAGQYQARFGLKIPEWRIMAVLGEGQPMTQRELVGMTRMDKVTVSRATAVLVDRGLIERAASRSDGRSHHLTLTIAGRTLYSEIASVAKAMEQSLLACLTAAERAQLSGMLDRLRGAADMAD